MIQLRDYQQQGAEAACDLLKDFHIAYLAFEVRTGKTLTALRTVELYGANKILFITKLKAISSIKDDYSKLECTFEMQVINYESLHKITDNDFDLIVLDENHLNSAFPKPNKCTKAIKERFGHLPMIMLSGTPAIESGSQWFNQLWLSNYSPFREFKNFYAWEKIYTKPKIKFLAGRQVRDYSDSRDEMILPIIEPYLLKYTQKEAGFVSEITEKVLYCEMKPITYDLSKRILKDQIIQGKDEVVLADNAAKLMSKVHQIENGTVIFESGNYKILDTTKAEFIKQYFKGKKIAMFYFFKAEFELLKSVFGETLTNDLSEFDSTNKHIALQQISGSEGLSLKNADVLVYYNQGYSGRHFAQGRDRMTMKDREYNDVFFVFSKDSINEKIYRTVKQKKRYNDKLFSKQYNYIKK